MVTENNRENAQVNTLSMSIWHFITKMLRFIICGMLYFVWIISMIALRIGMTGDNTRSSMCNIDGWRYGDFFQWSYGEPCAFTSIYYISMYCFIFTFYPLFDCIQRLVSGETPTIKSRLMEVIPWFLFELFALWGFLEVFDWMIAYTGFLGLLLYFIPIIAWMLITKYLSKGKLLLIFGVMLIFYMAIMGMSIHYVYY